MGLQFTKVIALYLTALVSIIFISCASVQGFKKNIKADDIQIPEDFGEKEGPILVILKGKRIYDRYYEMNFRENYTGKFIFISEGEDRDPQYKDVAQYHYIFGQDVDVSFLRDRQTRNMGVYKYGSFFLFDRQTKRLYQTKARNAAWSKLMRAYIQVLEETRLENQGKK
jgi:hypothetical protein